VQRLYKANKLEIVMSHAREIKGLLEQLIEKVEQLTKKVDALADKKAAKSDKTGSSASTKGGNK